MNSVIRRKGVLVAVSILSAALSSCQRQTNEEEGPADYNVVLVTLDTTRADRLGCYGWDRGTSANLDALARDGIRFDFAISSAAVTPVSHASILTGLNPYQHGLRVIYAASHYQLPESVPTLATTLRERGWRTGAFVSSFTVSDFFGLQHGFEVFDSGLEKPAATILRPRRNGAFGWAIRDNQRRCDETTDRALAWLGGKRNPFLLWLHFWDPHDPFLAPPHEVQSKFVRSPGESPDARRDLYDAEVFFVDQQIGRVVAALKQAGQYENTIIVVVADHGEGLGDHDHWHHRILYQEQIRVPLIMRMPHGPTGRTVTELVRTIDILPTILTSLRLKPPGRMEGLPLQQLMSSAEESPRTAYADALNLYDLNSALVRRRPKDDLLFCAMDREWKLIYRLKRPDESELYHLTGDPGELTNVYEANPSQARRLLEVLKASGGFVDKPFGTAADPDVLGRLRTLGYVGDENEEPEASSSDKP